MSILNETRPGLLSGAIVATALTATSVVAEKAVSEYFLYGYPIATREGKPFTRTVTIETGNHHCDSDCKG